MTLKDGKNGKEYIVEQSMLKQPEKRRLEAMGLIEGTRICKLNEAIDGSIIFNVRGTRLAIGNDLASDIIIREVTASDERGKRRGRGLGLRNGKGRGSGMGRKRGSGIGPRNDKDNCVDIDVGVQEEQKRGKAIVGK